VSWGFAAGSVTWLDHRGVPLSLVCRLVRCLIGLLAVLVRSDLSKDAELLVLRRQRPPGIETQPVRDVAELRSVRRRPVVGGVSPSRVTPAQAT
jgi:hypothetical protein